MIIKGKTLNPGTFILYVFGFLLLLEWMYPVEQLTDTGNIWVFVVFMMLSLVLSWLSVRPMVRFPIKIVYVLFALQYLYFESFLFSFEWLFLFARDVAENTVRLFSMQWVELSDMFRSVLFFVLLGLMTYLMRYWLVEQRKILGFYVMTIVFITVLDTFTEYDASAAIIRTLVLGFLLLGILTLLRVTEKEKIPWRPEILKYWLLPLAFLITASAFFAWLTPKAGPKWPDPVPYIESFVDGLRNGTIGAGFDSDETKLGGPFRGDDQVRYVTKTRLPHYWRVETKDVYTGKSWRSSQEETPVSLPDGEVFFFPFTRDYFTLKAYEAYVETYNGAPFLIYPAGTLKISSPEYNVFAADMSTERIYANADGKKYVPQRYGVFYAVPSFDADPDLLKQVPVSRAAFSGEEDFYQRYTQLPGTLPSRVKKLAEELTAGHTNLYDQVKAVENYFHEGGFVYEQTNVPVPGRKEDYVDQFLFETKMGYCDNFSTAMVVLLRSVGIPSRWVKGYTEGRYRGVDGEGYEIREITNNHAHSWPEVYFPGVGWVPFEPTVGYGGFGSQNGDLPGAAPEVPESPAEQSEMTEPDGNKPAEEQEPEDGAPENGQEESADEAVSEHPQGRAKNIHLLLAAASGFAGLLASGFYVTRKKWLPYYYLHRFRGRNENEAFLEAYRVLLKQLERRGIKRRPEQTLGDYAQTVDKKFSTADMSMMTKHYEQYLYKGVLEEDSWRTLKEAWERLMKTLA